MTRRGFTFGLVSLLLARRSPPAPPSLSESVPRTVVTEEFIADLLENLRRIGEQAGTPWVQ